jgi:hypothetical protein
MHHPAYLANYEFPAFRADKRLEDATDKHAQGLRVTADLASALQPGEQRGHGRVRTSG